ncbi:hypothetical protein L5515_000647 [Caenorhabditis briggsae]|uniref:Calmodulin-binding domain-containing protein n=2 Tax=Caenorhabditis TaxID=6237 RepID=A0AAE9E145_CAEBR|nr:hypothetical protein L5515_000647 [Caenorhabditis briggsae]
MSASPMLQHMYSLDESSLMGVSHSPYRQQRKRRAGISGATTSVQRDGPFACAGGTGYSSAGFSNGRGFPPLGGRSPQSSFDSNQDVAQISMNWMRMNGLGPSLRPFLNGGNHTPKKTIIHNSQSTTQISRLGSLRRMHAAEASIDGKLSLSGTQADVTAVCATVPAFSVLPVDSFLPFTLLLFTRPRLLRLQKFIILFELSPSLFSPPPPTTRSSSPSPAIPLRSTHSSASLLTRPIHETMLGSPVTDNPDDPLLNGGSSSAPKSILRAPRLTSAPKQLSFDVPASPTPTAKSSCVSTSGSYHMFERPNRLRAGKFSYGGLTSNHNHHQGHISLTSNGTPVFSYNCGPGGSCNPSPCSMSPLGTIRRDPSKWKLSDLKQRSNSESMFRNFDPEMLADGGRRMSMAYLPSREQALLRRILGPQGLSWISHDRETASRKSVSIAYSNDLEAGKGGGTGDDSTTPLMDEKDENSGGRLIRREHLHEKRRSVSDKALAFAVIGIILMIIENELRTGLLIRPGSFLSQTLKLSILATTAILLSFVGYFHVIEIQLFMNANAAEDWMVALSFRRIYQICLELFICMLCPIPIEFIGPFVGEKVQDRSLYAVNVLLSIMMFFRLYWLCRVMLLHSRLFTDASSRSIAGLNRVNFNARFILKTLMTMCPGTMLMIFTAFLWMVAGWILRLCERDSLEKVDPLKEFNYINSIWLVAITFLSVGYGDIVPKTYCGRSMAVVTGILGTCASSMVVAVIARKLELTRAEKHVHNFMQDTQLTRQLKHSAANVLRETWFIYKYRKLIEKPDHSKIRKHTRKFLLAIYEMRRVRRDQRKLAENLVSLGDVAKTSSNTYELVHDVHSTQEGLSLRITAIEHQLSDISRELSSLAELLRGSVLVTSDQMNNERRVL